MQPAIQKIWQKRTKDGYWNLQDRHTGKVFFHMEKIGKPRRWNTLRAMAVLNMYAQALEQPDMDRLINDSKCQTVTSMTKRYKPLSG
ncbi:MAG: hypothetical protein M0Q99_05630 [Candidatus Cloacimonetes bacterium]|nr:hypothetical protein [Candidatus Cloacimonadota bacterium]